MCNCDVSEKGLALLKEEIFAIGGKSESYIMDVSNKGSIQAAVDAILEKFGRIDVLINVAGINRREGFLDVKEETYDRIMDINLKAFFWSHRRLFPQ